LGAGFRQVEQLREEVIEMDDKLLLRAEDVQQLLGIGRWKVYEMITRGELPVLRIGRLIRVPRPALDDWIVANTCGAASSGDEAA
jgi:excisionase family DNA binding protein